MVDPLSYFSFQPVLNDLSNKSRGMCYPVCGMMHIKEPLLLIGKSSPCSGDSGFPLSLSEWSFTICPTPYNRKIKCVECVVNKTFPSFLPVCGMMHINEPLLLIGNSSPCDGSGFPLLLSKCLTPYKIKHFFSFLTRFTTI